jgi:hypothetical protein
MIRVESREMLEAALTAMPLKLLLWRWFVTTMRHPRKLCLDLLRFQQDMDSEKVAGSRKQEGH